MQCMLDMPRTDFALKPDNAMAQLFYGKLPIERAVAYFYFAKGSDYRRLIHRIKYNGEKECGYYLGVMMARELSSTDVFEGIDYIVPVPLHRKKQRKRGYNQSEWIAQGIADELGVELCAEADIKSKSSSNVTSYIAVERLVSALCALLCR